MGVFSRVRGSNNAEKDDKKQTGPTSSRMEARLQTARILAEDDDDDEPNRRRTQAKIERDLSDPRVHKRIVENLYGAYKIRVRYIYIYIIVFLLSFVFSRSSKRSFFDAMRNEKSKNIASFSLCSRFFAFEREFASTRAMCGRRDGLRDGWV
jgi:hypothetical protein